MNAQPDIRPVQRERSFLSKLFQVIFILVLLAAVTGCDFYAVQVWQHLRATHSWPDTTGVIRQFNTHRGGWNRDKYQYVVDVAVHYTVNDTTFAATNTLPGTYRSSWDADKAAQALRAKGSYLPVFYDPSDPADCVLSRNYPDRVLVCFGILAAATVLAVVWFGRRLVRLALGRENIVLIHPEVPENAGAPGTPASPWQKPLRWFFAGLGAVSCWWMAFLVYRDWGLPANARTLPSAELIFIMEFILAHSGVMVPSLLSASNQTRQSKTKGMIFLVLVYLTFVTSIAVAAHSVQLFVTFTGIMVSRWVGLVLDSDKARRQQMTRSAETFLIFMFSLGVFLLLLRLPLTVALIAYFILIGMFEATLPSRKGSWIRLPTA